MSYDIQVDGVNEQRTIVISEIIPTLSNESTNNEYNFLFTTCVEESPSAGLSKLTKSGATWGVDTLIGRVVLVLTGPGRGKCYTIYDNDADDIYIYDPIDPVLGDETASDYIGTTQYVAIVHSASTMYDYCVTNNNDCIAVTCENVPFIDGSPENPKSYADHITMRIGTGVYEQSIQFANCNVWRASPLDRVWVMNQIRALAFKWHELSYNNAVYLIFTTEHLVGGNVYRQNWDWFDVGDDGDVDTFGRGYLKGFPMRIQGTQEYSPEFTLQFKEAWLL